MTETTTQVERVARAIYEEDDPWHKAWPWPDLNENQGSPDQYRRIATAAIKAMSDAEPVAVIGRNWALHWASAETLTEIVNRNGLKIGSPLYAAPKPNTVPIPHEVSPQGRDEVERLREALARQCDNMAFVLNKATLPDQWYCKFSNELGEDRAAL